jgi:hypothetical protein
LRGARIVVGPLLVGASAAVALASVVKQQDVKAGGYERPGFEQTVADIAGVAVAEEDVPGPAAGRARKPPSGASRSRSLPRA